MLHIIRIAILMNFSVFGSVTIENVDRFQVLTRRNEIAFCWKYRSEKVSVNAFQGDKSKMNDRFFVDENIENTGVSLYAIFHGHGGNNFSAKYAVEELMNSLKRKIITIKKTKRKKDAVADLKKYMSGTKHVDYINLLKDEITSFDENLVQKLREQGNISGTTALITVIDGKKAYIANVGDSRAVSGDKKGTAKRLTKDHKPKARLEEERIKKAGGRVEYDSREQVYRVDGLTTSRVLGDFLVKPYKRVIADPDVNDYNLSKLKSSFIILASNGLWDSIGDTEAVTYVKENVGTESFGAKSIVDKAYESQSPENITVIIVKTSYKKNIDVSTLDSNVVEHSNHELLIQSVTLTTKMSKDIYNNNNVGLGSIGSFAIRSEDLPLVVCVITSTVLILLLLVALLLWKCCISNEKQKPREAINIETIDKDISNRQNYPASYPDSRNNQYTSRVVELIPEHDGPICWLYKNHEFVQVPYGSTGDTQPCSVSNIEIIARPPRPRSQPVVPPSVTSLDDYSLPQISEFCAHPCQYASNNIIDECCTQPFTANNFRTRSLPSCVRHKKHRIAPNDSTNDLYDKVNFSKKRKNRMRNDEAAIIALSKSRSQFFNKDTDTLVDNEAVIVYDERTAL